MQYLQELLPIGPVGPKRHVSHMSSPVGAINEPPYATPTPSITWPAILNTDGNSPDSLSRSLDHAALTYGCSAKTCKPRHIFAVRCGAAFCLGQRQEPCNQWKHTRACALDGDRDETRRWEGRQGAQHVQQAEHKGPAEPLPHWPQFTDFGAQSKQYLHTWSQRLVFSPASIIAPSLDPLG